MAIWVELTREAAARFTAWLGEVAKPDIDLELLEYEMDGVLGGFLTVQEGAIYTLHAVDTRSGRPETFALKREDVVIKRVEE
jgi:hypothetical protein